ncbi:hypothetical protein LYSHEL_19450 [Lysobacter helvus]|uniref:Uncharacterized protein n=2 Tax=Lysobacteraceae TaxID=32033 RepID=A0ABM7Q6H9_9GAMM|nr:MULTISPECIES: hypothetical protein [Lysobacter]BCT92922.1 hypothetical protein LYSCAS_19460 [Lysobacter caseinilyticus]BCT96074.1 hypothetical protein LYSHEL_19450 [Lysobacter helvus]
MSNDTKPEITGTKPATPEVSKVDATDPKFAAAPKAMSDADKKSLEEGNKGSSTAPASNR